MANGQLRRVFGSNREEVAGDWVIELMSSTICISCDASCFRAFKWWRLRLRGVAKEARRGMTNAWGAGVAGRTEGWRPMEDFNVYRK